jgi:hypothetical protein
VLFISCSIALAQDAGKPAPQRPAVDIVFCIDCSGSMGGVIEAAKQKVWAIVNEVARVRPVPVLRIGLYGYGNSEGPFRKFELSDDLDGVYRDLMTFKDEGWGSEFVGLVIQRAADEMNWAEGDQVLKIIYVVGNETARQGPVDYQKSAPAAVAKGIIVNAIYCGNTNYREATPTWRELARLADGQYMEISADGGAIVMNTPFDEPLAALNTKLNGTYLAYGALAAESAANQVAQDQNSLGVVNGGYAVIADRAAAKASPAYSNARWDLVDAAKQTNFNLGDIKEDQLPEELRQLAPEERMKYIETKATERAEIQKQIQELAAKRQAFVQEEVKKQGLASDKALDAAVTRSIREQAQKKGFELEERK